MAQDLPVAIPSALGPAGAPRDRTFDSNFLFFAPAAADATAAWNGAATTAATPAAAYPPAPTETTNGVGPVRSSAGSASKAHHHPYHRK